MADSATEAVVDQNRPPVAVGVPENDQQKSFFLKVLAVEKSLGIPQADGVYDPATQEQVENFIVNAFADYYSQQKAVWEQQHPGQPFALRVMGAGTPATYEFDESGDIYALKNDSGQIVRGDKVSNIRTGIRRTLNDSTNPHEAAHALISTITLQRQNELRHDGLDEKEQATRALGQTIRNRLQQWGQPELEQNLRNDLRAASGNIDTFKQSASVQKLKESGVDDVALNDFLLLLLQQQAATAGISAETGERAQQSAQHESVGDLLHFMATGVGIDPMLQAQNNAGAGLRDNILGIDAYDVLNRMHEGEYIAVDALFDQNNPAQFQSIQAYFGDKSVEKNGVHSVTREQVFEYVKQEFEKRAIERLGSLDKVSQAMFNGQFNPYEKDIHLVFKGFPSPDFNDPTWRRNVDDLRRGGTFPTAEFTMQVLGDGGIAELIKADPSAFQSLRGTTAEEKIEAWGHTRVNERIEILDSLNKAPSAAIMQNEHFARQTHAFYEEYAGNYTWWRNGETNTNDQNTWNGRYGSLNKTQEMHMYMRFNRFDLDQTFGKEIADEVFRNQDGRITYDAQYDTVVAALNAKDPSGALVAKLNQGIENLSRPSMYSYLMDNRLDYYRQMRTNIYMPSIAPPPAPQNGAVGQAGPGGTGTDGQNADSSGAGTNGSNLEGQNNDPLADPTIPGDENTRIDVLHEGDPEDHVFPAKNPTGALWGANRLRNRFSRSGSPIPDTPIDTAPKARVLEGHVIDSNARRIGHVPEIIDAEFTEVKSLTDQTPRARALSGAHPTRALTATDNKGALTVFNEASGRVQPLPKNRSLVIISQSTDVAHFEKIAGGSLLKAEVAAGEAAARAGSKLSVFGKIAGKAKFIPLLGTAIGGGAAAWETSNLRPRLDTLQELGLITARQASSIKTKYNWFIAQGAFDVTMVGGEMALASQFAGMNLNPAIRAMIEPDYLYDGFGSPKANHSDVVKLYNRIANQHGLPETIKVDLGSHGKVEMSIGSAMCDPQLANHLRNLYAEDRKALQGLEKLDTLNEVTKQWVEVKNEPSLFAENAASMTTPHGSKALSSDFKPLSS